MAEPTHTATAPEQQHSIKKWKLSKVPTWQIFFFWGASYENVRAATISYHIKDKCIGCALIPVAILHWQRHQSTTAPSPLAGVLKHAFLSDKHTHIDYTDTYSRTHRHEFATVNAKLFVSNLENGMHRRKTHTLLQLYMHSYTYMCVRVCVCGDVPIMKHAMYYNWVLSIFTLFSGQRPESFAAASLFALWCKVWTADPILCTYVCMYIHTCMYVSKSGENAQPSSAANWW